MCFFSPPCSLDSSFPCYHALGRSRNGSASLGPGMSGPCVIPSSPQHRHPPPPSSSGPFLTGKCRRCLTGFLPPRPPRSPCHLRTTRWCAPKVGLHGRCLPILVALLLRRGRAALSSNRAGGATPPPEGSPGCTEFSPPSPLCYILAGLPRLPPRRDPPRGAPPPLLRLPWGPAPP